MKGGQTVVRRLMIVTNLTRERCVATPQRHVDSFEWPAPLQQTPVRSPDGFPVFSGFRAGGTGRTFGVRIFNTEFLLVSHTIGQSSGL
jgi:hypothetical protein